MVTSRVIRQLALVGGMFFMLKSFTDDQFAAWLAGFFDGEGCIQVPTKTGVELTIANTNKDIVFSIRDRLGVGVISEVRFVNKPRWKTKYAWRERRYEEAGVVLKMMLPFLTIKREKAVQALARISDYKLKRKYIFDRNMEVARLKKLGHSHKEIGAIFDMKTSTVTAAAMFAKRGMYPPRKRKSLISSCHVSSKQKTSALTVSKRLVGMTRGPRGRGSQLQLLPC